MIIVSPGWRAGLGLVTVSSEPAGRGGRGGNRFYGDGILENYENRMMLWPLRGLALQSQEEGAGPGNLLSPDNGGLLNGHNLFRNSLANIR